MTDLRFRTVTGSVTTAEGRARARITTFNQPYEYAPRVREEISPSAFDGVDTIPVMYQHQHDEPPVGTATLTRDATGINADIQFFLDTERGRAAFNAYHTGAMKEWSVGFAAKPDQITTTRADGYVNERIDKGDLMEVSTVLRGANKGTKTMHTRADGDYAQGSLGKFGSNNTSSAFGQDTGAATPGGRDSDTHQLPLKNVEPNMNDAMAVMAGAMKQMNAAHALLQQAHVGLNGGLTAPSTDDDDDTSQDQGGPVLQDPAAASGAALRYDDAKIRNAAGNYRDRMDYSADQRKTMAKSGEALPDGSYPIANATDLENAIHAIGRGNDPHSEIRAHIEKRAKALGLEKMLPADWADGATPADQGAKARAYFEANLQHAWAREGLRHLS